MKKYLLFTLMLFASPVVFAQTTVDTVDIRICYDVRMRLYKNKKKRVDEHWLDIGKNGISKYYSYWKRVDQELKDSVYAAGGDYDEYNKIKREKDNPRSSFEFTIFKNYQQNDQLTGICTPYSGSKYLFTEEMGQDWELVSDSVHHVLEHPCRKATARFHGRTWTAYYATDIPVPEGPWKLCGLPGLIMYACDSEKDYIFSCMAIKTKVGEPLTFDKDNAITITPQKLEKTLYEYRSNPLMPLMARTGGDVVVRDSRGREVKQRTYEPVLLEYYRVDK